MTETAARCDYFDQLVSNCRKSQRSPQAPLRYMKQQAILLLLTHNTADIFVFGVAGGNVPVPLGV